MFRILKELFSKHNFYLEGAGLLMSPDFVKAIKDATGTSLMTVNLDPNNEQLKNKQYSHRIPLDDSSLDFIFALEIIEHLTSPTHLFKEARRVLKPGGRILITTPNISRIGSIFKLLIGESNADRLIKVDYHDEDDEWRPHFHEYSMHELSDFVSSLGFVVDQRSIFNCGVTKFNVKNLRDRFRDLVKIPFYCMPHFRDDLLIIARKK